MGLLNYELHGCYRVIDRGTSLIVRCRFCSAGWLPVGWSSSARPLLIHAREKHRRRLPKILPPYDLQRGMIKIPDDAAIVRDSRLDMIRAVNILQDRLIDGTDGLKNKVRSAMMNKSAIYAQSDLCIAALRAGAPRSPIDPAALYELVKAGKLTMPQFLSVVSVRKEPLKEFLSGAEIDRLSTAAEKPEPYLVTEFRDGVPVDLDQLAAGLQSQLNRMSRLS
jgi:hypothetical protein